MERVVKWGRNLMAFVGVLALGYWLGNSRPVKADGGDVQFQLTGVSQSSSLLVYQPGTKTVYVYQGANAGNSVVNCSYMYKVGDPGKAIQRVNCQAGSAF